MKKKLVAVVCIAVIAVLGSGLISFANDNNTIEYTFDIVRASAEAGFDGGSDITVDLYTYKAYTKAKVVVWFYDEKGYLTGFETKDITAPCSTVTLHTYMDFESGYVSVWESYSSLKPLAKKVEIGHRSESSYRLEYYKQNVERNGYILYSSSEFNGVMVGDVISLNEASLPVYEGFSFDSSNADNVLSGTVTPGGLVLKVYYNHIVDEIELQQVISRLNKLLTAFEKLYGNFTGTEGPLVKVCIDTVEAVLADADAGALIYIEDYVQTKYRANVDDARGKLDTLKAAGGYTDFKTKLTKKLSLADVEYLAKIMFGIDDIYQYEKDNL